MEPHVALQLIEKIVRLMQPAAAEASSQVASGADAGYEKNQKPDDKVRSLTAVAETFGC
jgi:CRISPR/Cas system-associated protein Csm6